MHVMMEHLEQKRMHDRASSSNSSPEKKEKKHTNGDEPYSGDNTNMKNIRLSTNPEVN